MTTKEIESAQTLRQRAEEKLKACQAANPEALSPEETVAALHELRVHQIELEMQNEELQRSQLELDSARARYFDLYDLAPAGYLTLSEKGLILEANITAGFLLGVVRAALVMQPISHFIVKEDHELYYRYRQQLVSTGEPQACELRMLKADGAPFWVYLRANRAPKGDGDDVPAYRIVINDISDRKLAEQALQNSEEKFRALFENAKDGIILLSSHGELIALNSSFANMHGNTVNEMLAMNLKDLDTPQSVALAPARFSQMLAGEPLTFEVEHYCKNGQTIPLEVSASTIDLGGVKHILGFHRDITERKQMEKSLRQSEEKYRTVANFTHDWEFWIGPDRSILYCSPSCEQVTGHSAAEFEENPSLIRQLVHPEDLAAYDQHRHSAENQQNCPGFEFRLIHADGEIRWLDHVCMPVYDGKGQFIGTRGSNRDITKNKELQAEVMKMRNLEALGSLAGGIAHDFNNLFQGLLGNISLAQMYIPESSEAFKYLQNAEQVYIIAAKLTSQLGSFSSGCISRLENLNLADFVRDAITTELSGSDRVAEFNLAEDLFLVNVDPFQFRQVLKHMTINAIEAMPTGGKLRVMAANEILSSEGVNPATLANGHYVKVSIQDQGCGISKETLPRIFDPYFSTKERCSQKGMGLGLSLCDTTIRKHGGLITVETEPGKGTTFHLHLPAVVPVAKKTEPRVQKSGGQGRRILLMDDDEAVVQVTAKFLSLSGFRVDSTFDGDAAIIAYQKARENGDPYAVVILDLVINGGKGGKEVITILKGIDPEVKAIVSSGYADDRAMTNFADYGFVAACAKPYLSKEMKALLDNLA